MNIIGIIKKSFWVLTLFLCGHLRAQVDVSQLVQYCDSMMNYGVEVPMIPGAVIGLASSDSILLLKGYGYSDYNNKYVVDPEKTLFQLGSIGKLLTSIAFLQQVDEGKISLNDDVNNYLNGWKISNSFNQPVTPFHLLTHTGGFNDQFIGYLAQDNASVESLGIHLPKTMPGLFIPPGREINYSNYGYALAGHLVELVTGNQFKDQINQMIFKPLHMSTATYVLPDDYLSDKEYANGYLWRDTFVQTKMYPRHATPAGSTLASGLDMVTLSQALLRRDSVLLSPRSYDLLFNQQFTNHPLLTGYTLGMEVQNFHGHIAIAKAGQVTGFLSMLILFPDLDLSLFISTNTETDNYFEQFFEGLINRFFQTKKTNNVSIDIDVNEYVGDYANERCNHETLEEMFAMFDGQFTIYKSASDNLRAYHNSAWHDYYHIGNDVFQDESDPHIRIAFKRDGGGDITSMYRSVNVGGLHVPASYRKLGWLERPRFINDEYPYLLTIMMTYILLPLLWLARYFIRKKRPAYLSKSDISFLYHAAAFLFIGLFIWNIIGFFIPLIRLGEGMALGFPESLIAMKYVNWAMAISAFFLFLLSVHLWYKNKSSIWFRIYYTIVGLIALSYVFLLDHWHLLNVTI